MNQLVQSTITYQYQKLAMESLISRTSNHFSYNFSRFFFTLGILFLVACDLNSKQKVSTKEITVQWCIIGKELRLRLNEVEKLTSCGGRQGNLEIRADSAHSLFLHTGSSDQGFEVLELDSMLWLNVQTKGLSQFNPSKEQLRFVGGKYNCSTYNSLLLNDRKAIFSMDDENYSEALIRFESGNYLFLNGQGYSRDSIANIIRAIEVSEKRYFDR